MTDTVAISPNGRTSTATAKRANLAAVGATGVVSYGGQLYDRNEYDSAWVGVRRDKTIHAMLNDPLIGAVLYGIEMLVRRVDWRVEPADDSAEAEAAKVFVEECLDDMRGQWPGEPMARVLTGIGWGWAVLEVVHKRRQGPDGAQPSRFTDGKIGWDRWTLLPQPTRYGWRFGPDGSASVLIQQDPESYRMIEVPLGRCVHLRFGARDNSPEGFTPLRVAYDAWYYKRNLQRFEAIGFERWLAGLPVGEVPGAEIEGNTAVYQAMQSIVTGIRQDSQAGLVLASDRDDQGNRLQDVRLLAPGGQASPNTDPVIRRYANEVVTVFLAQVMRAGQDGVGTFALGEVQGGLMQQAIGAHLDTIADAVNEQAVAPLCRLNAIPLERMPRLAHGDVENADLAALGAYLVNLSTAGVLTDTPELRSFLHEIAGLPVPSVEEIAAQQEEEEAAAEAMAQQIAGQGPPSEDDDDEEEPPADERRAASEVRRMAERVAPDDPGLRVFGSPAHRSRWQAFADAVEPHERSMTARVRSLFRGQREAVVGRLAAEPIEAVAADPFDLASWNTAFRVQAGPVLRRAADAAGDAALAELGLSVGFDVLDPNVTTFLNDRAQRFAERVNETTWRQLRASLSEGITAGEGIDALADRVNGVMGHRIRSSAETIARTEIMGAYSGATQMSWEQSGVVSGKQWLAALDDRTRETHISAHGQTVGLRQNFHVGGASGPTPGQMGEADEDCNCRCSMIAVLSETED